MNTQELLLHDVALHSARGKDVIRVQVPAHELSVLRVVHNASNVRDLGITDEVDDFPVRAADEIARLQRKYRRINEPDPVRMAYPGMDADLERHGFVPGGQSSATTHSSVKRRPRRAAGARLPSGHQPPPEGTAGPYPGVAFVRDAAGPVEAEPLGATPVEGEARPPEPEKPVKAAKAK